MKTKCLLNPTGCGAVVNNVLKSPGYPNNYPNNMDCVYRVQIPHGMAIRICFSNFTLEGYSSCRYKTIECMITVVVIVSLFCLYLLEPCFFSLGLSISLSVFGPFPVILIPLFS